MDFKEWQRAHESCKGHCALGKEAREDADVCVFMYQCGY